jgi:hypothetical protein
VLGQNEASWRLEPFPDDMTRHTKLAAALVAPFGLKWSWTASARAA